PVSPLAAVQTLLPVIQFVIRVRDGYAGLLEIANGASDVACCQHAMPRIVVEEDDQNALVVTPRGKAHEVVQVLKIVHIPCQNSPLIPDGMGQVGLIVAAYTSDGRRSLNVVPVTAQQSDESGIDAVVVQIQPHNPSLTRSSVVRGRGLPMRQIAGSFMP